MLRAGVRIISVAVMEAADPSGGSELGGDGSGEAGSFFCHGAMGERPRRMSPCEIMRTDKRAESFRLMMREEVSPAKT